MTGRHKAGDRRTAFSLFLKSPWSFLKADKGFRSRVSAPEFGDSKASLQSFSDFLDIYYQPSMRQTPEPPELDEDLFILYSQKPLPPPPPLPPLARLPAELINSILEFLPFEADQQCLRVTCRHLFNILPRAVMTADMEDEENRLGFPANAWIQGNEQYYFLERLFRDMPASARDGKKVCMICRMIVPVKVFGQERSCKRCTDDWWNKWDRRKL